MMQHIVTIVNIQDVVNIKINVVTIVIDEEIIDGIDCEIICLNVTTSLV